MAGNNNFKEETGEMMFDASGNLKVNIVAGGAGDGSILDGVDTGIKATVKDLANSNPVTVAIVDGSGDQITSFGGGTQYSDGDANADPTGTVAMGTDGSNVFALTTDTSGHLQVDVLTMPAGGSGLTDAELRATPVPVSGTVTADLGATDNAVLDAIAASVAAIDTDTTTIIGHVDGLEALIGTTNSTLTTIDGRVDGLETLVTSTNTKLDTVIGHVDGVEGILTTIDGDTGNIVTSVQLLDDTVQVLGTDTYTEATSKGLTIGAVRRDADTTLVNTTNEFGPLQMDANGRLKVEAFSGETLPVSLTSTTITGTVAVTQSGTWDEVGINDSGNSITVDNNGTFVTQVDGAALTALQLIDDTVATLGTTTYTETTTKGNIIGAVRRDADTTLVDTTNEIGPLQMDANGRLKVEVFSGETLPVSGTVTANLAAGTNNIGDVDILTIAAGDNNIGNVDIVTMPNVVIGSGTVTTVSTVSSVTQNADVRQATASNFNAQVVGNVAHDAGDSGNPIGVGYRAISHGTNPTAVASLDRTVGYANIAGIPFVMGGHPNIVSAEYNTTGAQTDDNILPAIAGGTIYVITSVSVMVSNATTVSPSVRIGFGTATLTASGASGADAVTKIILSHPGIAPGSGIVKGTGSGIVGIGGDGEELRITCSAPTTGSIFVQVDYYTITS